jgi:L-threonylcarbamoyladenylate synthase
VKTRISTDPGAAVELLRRGEIVALPTETVYGLAADALNPIAVAKIFEAKERPRFDPLIVHLPDRDWLGKIVAAPAQDRPIVDALINEFWPGPLTLVLPKQEAVPGITTAGLETVAVRMSAHPVFAEICRAVGPIAAPSANRFGRISPTTAAHVMDELRGRIPLIIDGGATTHGIESTIVMVAGGTIEILRRGPVTDEQIATVTRGTGLSPVSHRQNADATVTVIAPGQLPSHYAPNKPLQLVDRADEFDGAAAGLLAWHHGEFSGYCAVRQLSPQQDLREAAANLFRYLRELDAEPDVEVIIAERVPDQGLGAAIMDRLRRAAAPRCDGPGRRK